VASNDPEAVLRALADCWQRGDADAAAALLASDAVFSEPPAPALSGRAAIHAFFADFAARHHAVTFDIVRVLPAPDGTLAAAEWRFAFTRTADGKQTVYEGMCWIELRGGLVTRWHGFFASIPPA
jgi:uncharacterized protein (TIGR02246 family)